MLTNSLGWRASLAAQVCGTPTGTAGVDVVVWIITSEGDRHGCLEGFADEVGFSGPTFL